MVRAFLKSALDKWRSPVKADQPGDANAPLAALLVRAARANSDYDPQQIAEIDRVTASRFGLSVWECIALRREAEALEETVGDTVHLTRRIKQAVALEDRPALLRDLWSVILADGKRHDEEDGLMRLVSSLLGLSDRDSAFARQEVQQGRDQGVDL